MSAWQNSWAIEDDQQIITIVFSLDVQKRIAKIYVSINVHFVAVILTSSLPLEAWSFYTYLPGFSYTRYSLRYPDSKSVKHADLVGLIT